jgi:D-alanyl-D-alanine carboxypeptidase
VGVVLAALAAALVVDLVVLTPSRRAPTPTARFVTRNDLASEIDGLVIGTARTTPGATAYVSWPGNYWVGAAGVANVTTGAAIRPDARMRLESISKDFLATIVLQLTQEGKLRVSDTVAKWLPGLLPNGGKITVRELMTDRSGLIDDNDLLRSGAAARGYLVRVKDSKLRAQLAAIAHRWDVNPALEVSPIWLIRFAAWQPLLFTPGSRYHHSNIGWNILGMIAARAAGKPLPELYRERIFEPLGLKHTAYNPQGPIAGPHANGYAISPNGKLTDETAWHFGKGPDGAIVSDAQDTATFFTALMQGRLLDRQQLDAMKGADFWLGGEHSCAGGPVAYGGTGEGDAYTSEVIVNGNGTSIAVLLMNARSPFGLQTADATVVNLYCAA